MSKAGRKTKPTKLKLLEGNQHPERVNLDEPKPDVSIPTCPVELSDKAKTEWYRISAELKALGIISQLDLAALAGYCQAYANFLKAQEDINAHGQYTETSKGYEIQRPSVGIANQSMTLMLKYLSELGLSPTARPKLHVPKAGEEESPMAKLLKKKVKLIG